MLCHDVLQFSTKLYFSVIKMHIGMHIIKNIILFRGNRLKFSFPVPQMGLKACTRFTGFKTQ